MNLSGAAHTQSRTYWNISRNIIAKFTLGKKIRKCSLFTKFIVKNIVFFLSPGATITFSSLIIFGLSDARVAHSMYVQGIVN